MVHYLKKKLIKPVNPFVFKKKKSKKISWHNLINKDLIDSNSMWAKVHNIFQKSWANTVPCSFCTPWAKWFLWCWKFENALECSGSIDGNYSRVSVWWGGVNTKQSLQCWWLYWFVVVKSGDHITFSLSLSRLSPCFGWRELCSLLNTAFSWTLKSYLLHELWIRIHTNRIRIHSCLCFKLNKSLIQKNF